MRLSPMFFFQAEDGIRDDLVTGVQTCALPIFERRSAEFMKTHPRRAANPHGFFTAPGCSAPSKVAFAEPRDALVHTGRIEDALVEHKRLADRSEERRVGKSVDLCGRRMMKE